MITAAAFIRFQFVLKVNICNLKDNSYITAHNAIIPFKNLVADDVIIILYNIHHLMVTYMIKHKYLLANV